MKFFKTGLVMVGMLGALVASSSTVAAQDRDQSSEEQRRIDRAAAQQRQQQQQHAERTRDGAERETAERQRGQGERPPMSQAERARVAERYRVEAAHRDRVARMRRLYELAKQSGDPARIKQIEDLWHRQGALYKRQMQRSDQHLGQRRDLRDAADQHLQRGRGQHQGLERAAPPAQQRRPSNGDANRSRDGGGTRDGGGRGR